MKNAIIYTRVSTDEQAEKGYSLQYQLERIQKYCDLQSIKCLAHFKEDYSAKTFERPEFKKLMQFCKTNRGQVDLLLFLNWSRFSRNAGDSYAMIREFQRLGIEPQAIEQPLDLSVPENKMMLAFYLAAPEVENDRRSMNVRNGMRRAKSEGRYLGLAPAGYKNARDENNRPIIIPDPVESTLVIEAFERCAQQVDSIEEIRRIMNGKGLKVGRAAFPVMLRNRVYVGEVFISSFKEEKEKYVKGLHQALVSLEVFEHVQDILAGRAYKRPNKNIKKDELPLRGFLRCSVCGGVLTGSASHGNGGRYFYYHCQKGCPERFNASHANEQFEKYLSQLKPRAEIAELYQVILKDYFKDAAKANSSELAKLNEGILRSRVAIQKAQSLLLDDMISADDYREIKNREEKKIEQLNREMMVNLSSEDCSQYVEGSINLLSQLDVAYRNADIELKQKLVGSIFPGNLIFENGQYRTTELNGVLSLMCLDYNGLSINKNGYREKFSQVSAQVVRTGIEPVLPE